VFSRRGTWPARPNRWSSLRSRLEARGERLLDLTGSNPTRAGFSYPPEILEALSDPRGAAYEPCPLGLPAARQAVAALYADAGIPVDPKRVVLTASTSEAYAFLFKLLTDPGDAVLVPRPGYPLFDYLGGLESVQRIDYDLDPEDGWSIPIDALEACAGDGVRALILVSPGNPTGAYLKREEWGSLQDLCQRRSWAVIADEVFGPYALREDPARVACAAAGAGVLTFSLGGLSKWAGLPQLKLAWTVVGGPDDVARAALTRLEVIADTYLSVSSPVQWALPRILAAGRRVQEETRQRVAANRRALEEETAGSPCRAVPSEGGWSAVLRLPSVRGGEEWALTLLERDGVLVHPGYFYDFPREAYLVLGLLPQEGGFREGVRRLVARVQRELP
jgi:aspartate/methionine/tyrosine aminotransferase